MGTQVLILLAVLTGLIVVRIVVSLHPVVNRDKDLKRDLSFFMAQVMGALLVALLLVQP